MNCIQEEPVFAWWVSKVLRQRNQIISKVKSKYWKTKNNFWIRLPNTVEKELRIDKEDGNYYLEKALNNETSKVNFSRKRVDGVTPDQSIPGSVK